MLNAMGVGALDAPRAERVLRISDTGEPDRPHHVADPEGSSDRAGPTRPRAPGPGPHREHPLPGELWMLAVVHPGDPAGRPARPLDDERPGPRVRRHRRRPRGRVAWLPHPVGPAMQWRLARAERPLPPPTPGEAATALNAQVLVSARELAGLDAAAGRRPDDAAPVVLGGAYPTGNQRLLDRAILWREVCAAGPGADDAALHSHARLARSAHLRRIGIVCRQAISAAASWPDARPAGARL